MVTECSGHYSSAMKGLNQQDLINQALELENLAHQMANRADKLDVAFMGTDGLAQEWVSDLDFTALGQYFADLRDVSQRNAEVLGRVSDMLRTGSTLRKVR